MGGLADLFDAGSCKYPCQCVVANSRVIPVVDQLNCNTPMRFGDVNWTGHQLARSAGMVASIKRCLNGYKTTASFCPADTRNGMHRDI